MDIVNKIIPPIPTTLNSLPKKTSQQLQVLNILMQILRFRRFENHRMVNKAGIIYQEPEALQPDLPLTNMIMPIYPTAHLFLGVVEMEKLESLEAD